MKKIKDKEVGRLRPSGQLAAEVARWKNSCWSRWREESDLDPEVPGSREPRDENGWAIEPTRKVNAA